MTRCDYGRSHHRAPAKAYSYVNGNPVNMSDPSGHEPRCAKEGTSCAKQAAEDRAAVAKAKSFDYHAPKWKPKRTKSSLSGASLARWNATRDKEFVAMAELMNRFAASEDAAQLRDWNSLFQAPLLVPYRKAKAYRLFAARVAVGTEVDYKLHQEAVYGDWVPLAGTDFSILPEFSGNFLYGYVGKESGFNRTELVQASHAGGYAKNAKRFLLDHGADQDDRLVKGLRKVERMVGTSDKRDNLPIDMGIELSKDTAGRKVRPEDIRNVIEGTWPELMEDGFVQKTN